MKQVLRDKNYYILRFDKGEEAISGIAEFCSTEKISAGFFRMIGATDDLVLAYYDIEKKNYENHEKKERLEISSVIGNISVMEDKIVIHAHGTFSDKDLKVIGGHIKKLIVSLTCEVMFTKLDGTLERAHDDETGLNLLK
jgi:predicted DNA-binding protein with PD1-like motif